MAKKRVLFFAEAVTLAHVARPVVLAEALDPEIYEIHIACDPRFDRLFSTSSCFHHNLYSIPCADFVNSLAKGQRPYDTKTLLRYSVDELRLIDEIKPDLIVGDFRLSLAASAVVGRTPYVAISNAYWSPYTGRRRYPVPELALTRICGVEFAQFLFDLVRPVVFAWHSIPINRLRRSYGLRGLGWDLRRIYTWADHTLYADIPELVPTYNLPASHEYLGPILWSPSVPLPNWWDNLPGDKPIIYLTLGSSGRADLMAILLNALSDLPVTVIAATAGKGNCDYIPQNAFVTDYLPGDASVSRASLVICNGGSPTTHQALSHGIPLIGIPSNLDQHLNMDAIQRSGAGILIRSENAAPSQIRDCVLKILYDGTYTEAARNLAAAFTRYDTPSRFNALIRQII